MQAAAALDISTTKTHTPQPVQATNGALNGRHCAPAKSIKLLSISEGIMDIFLNAQEGGLDGYTKGSSHRVTVEVINNILKDNGIENLSEILAEACPIPEKIQIAPGGASANTFRGIAALAKRTWKYEFVGKVGDDPMGAAFRKSLTERHITPSLVTSNTITTLCLCLITPDKERTMLCCSGGSTELNMEDLQESFFEGLNHLHMDAYFVVFNFSIAQETVRRCKELGVSISFDLANSGLIEDHREKFVNMIKDATIVFANEQEAWELTKEQPEQAVETIGQMCSVAVVCAGDKGSWVYSNGDKIYKPAYSIQELKDTTGAGDMYAAGFLYKWLAGGSPLEECARFGNLLGSEIVQITGSQLPKDKWKEIREALPQN